MVTPVGIDGEVLGDRDNHSSAPLGAGSAPTEDPY